MPLYKLQPGKTDVSQMIKDIKVKKEFEKEFKKAEKALSPYPTAVPPPDPLGHDPTKLDKFLGGKKKRKSSKKTAKSKYAIIKQKNGKTKKVIIKGIKKVLYKKKGSQKKYVKSKGRMMNLTNYKKKCSRVNNKK